MSRIVCCCGKIRRPFGAALSIGTTSTTKSDGSRRSPTIFRSSSSFPFNAPKFFLQLINSAFIRCTYKKNLLFLCFQITCGIFLYPQSLIFLCKPFTFIQYYYIRYVLFLNPLCYLEIFFTDATRSINHNNSNVCLIQHLITLLHTKFTQFTFIINSRSIHHHNRTQRKKFHCLINRIRCCSFHIRNYRKILSCYRIHHA